MGYKPVEAVNNLLRKIRDEERCMVKDTGDKELAVPIYLIQPEIDEVARLVGQLERFAIQEYFDETVRSKRLATEIKEMEEINKEMLESLEKCVQALFFNQNHLPDTCKELLNDIQKVVKKVKHKNSYIIESTF